MRKLKYLSLFSGIGAFEKAFTNMGIDYDLINFCEIDSHAINSYCVIHNVPKEKNLCDVTTVNTSALPTDIDLISYGFPCQDISSSGLMRGFEYEGERTRSGLFFEALRIIQDCQPKVAICENVKNLTSKRFEKEFKTVLDSLSAAGYNNYWQVLDAQDYGIPQHRERVFIVSIRKDIDVGYEFPKPFPLECTYVDFLDETVDESYYLDESKVNIDTSEDGIYEDFYKNRDVRIYKDKSPAIRSGRNGLKVRNDLALRKITEREAWKFMGFTAEDYEKAAKVCKRSHLYKQAGNSIVVQVIENIYKSLFEQYKEVFK